MNASFKKFISSLACVEIAQMVQIWQSCSQMYTPRFVNNSERVVLHFIRYCIIKVTSYNLLPSHAEFSHDQNDTKIIKIGKG